MNTVRYVLAGVLLSGANADDITRRMMERAAQEGASMSLDESIQAKQSIPGAVLRNAGAAAVSAAKAEQNNGHYFNSPEAKSSANTAAANYLQGAGAVSAPQIAGIQAATSAYLGGGNAHTAGLIAASAVMTNCPYGMTAKQNCYLDAIQAAGASSATITYVMGGTELEQGAAAAKAAAATASSPMILSTVTVDRTLTSQAAARATQIVADVGGTSAQQSQVSTAVTTGTTITDDITASPTKEPTTAAATGYPTKTPTVNAYTNAPKTDPTTGLPLTPDKWGGINNRGVAGTAYPTTQPTATPTPLGTTPRGASVIGIDRDYCTTSWTGGSGRFWVEDECSHWDQDPVGGACPEGGTATHPTITCVTDVIEFEQVDPASEGTRVIIDASAGVLISRNGNFVVGDGPVAATLYPTSYPSPYPTPYPTSAPTTYPTPYPTSSPTTYPTPYPTPYPPPKPPPNPPT